MCLKPVTGLGLPYKGGGLTFSRLYISIKYHTYLFLCRMVGQVLGAVKHLPSIYTELEVSYYLLRRLLGVRTEGEKCFQIKSLIPS